MAVSLLREADVQLALLSTTGHVGLAVDILTERFGLPRAYAEGVVDRGRGVLFARMQSAHAQEAKTLLSAIGLQVVIRPTEAQPLEECRDISIKLSDMRSAAKVTNALSRMIGLTGIKQEDFFAPEGLVLSKVALSRVDWLCTSLRRIPHVYIAVSDPNIARYDLFTQRAIPLVEWAELRRFLRIWGADCDLCSDAVACDLTHQQMDRVLNQFPQLGLFGVNQSFQRHELLITGKGSLAKHEFFDFLKTRPVAADLCLADLERSLPLCDEPWLTRASALQFMSDYRAIGIEAHTRLAHTAPMGHENP